MQYLLPGYDASDYIACTGTNFAIRAVALQQVGGGGRGGGVGWGEEETTRRTCSRTGSSSREGMDPNVVLAAPSRSWIAEHLFSDTAAECAGPAYLNPAYPFTTLS